MDAPNNCTQGSPGLGVTYDWDKINRWETAREVYD
jgi:hypothetical protein